MSVAQETFQQLTTAGLEEVDPDVARLLGAELERQRGQIELIASENFTWPSVLEAVGSVPTNKYAEGYPGKRYYGGCEVVDEIEQLAIDRAKELFGAEHANVQPHAGAPTNMAVYMSVLQPGDTILALRLDHGGHLTHGLKVNFSGKLYTIVGYGVSRDTMTVDYDEVLRLAKESKPKLIVCGGSAYPRTVDRELLDLVDDLAAAVVAPAGIALGVLVRRHRPDRLEHRRPREVLRGDQLDLAPLALELGPQEAGDVGIDVREAGRGEVLEGLLGERHPGDRIPPPGSRDPRRHVLPWDSCGSSRWLWLPSPSRRPRSGARTSSWGWPRTAQQAGFDSTRSSPRSSGTLSPRHRRAGCGRSSRSTTSTPCSAGGRDPPRRVRRVRGGQPQFDTRDGDIAATTYGALLAQLYANGTLVATDYSAPYVE